MKTTSLSRLPVVRAAAIGALALAAAAAVLPASAMPGHHAGMQGGMQGGMHDGMHDGGPMMMMGSPERMERMLDRIGATAEQRSQIGQIVDAARKDLQARRDAGASLREQGRQIFTAPTVDARAAEAWRQQVQAQREEASKRAMQAMIDISRVLTPEQRTKIAERMAQRHAMMEHRHGAVERPAR